MLRLIMVTLSCVSICFAQEQSPTQLPAPQSATQAPDTSAAPAPKGMVTIPAGTRVQLTLSNPIHMRSVHKGDGVRAVTSFPVTVDTQLAIPAGTFVEGAIDKVIKSGASGRGGVEMHFTRMVFSNGYAVALDGATAEAKAEFAGDTFLAALMPESGEEVAAFRSSMFPQQQPPPLPPQPKSHMGVAIGVTVGAAAAGIIGAIVAGRHRGANWVLDTGAPFEMTLQNPISVDTNQVATATADSETKTIAPN